MGIEELENLAHIGKLKSEAFDLDEFKGLVTSGKVRLRDAKNKSLHLESRFDLAYNAAHSLALAALRRSGYRSENRYLVFQCLKHTLVLPDELWRVLDSAHRKRNLAEYEGVVDMYRATVEAIIRVATEIQRRLESK